MNSLSRLLENIGLKFLALFLAAGLFAYVAATSTEANLFPGDVPLTVSNQPAGLAPIYDADSVKISLEASQGVWARLKAESFRATLDLSGLAQGTYNVPVQITALEPGATVAEVEPKSVLVRLEPLAEKKLKTAVKIDGSPAAGFSPGAVSIQPAEATVRGPKSLIDKLTGAIATIHLNGESAAVEQTVPFEGKHLTFEPSQAVIKLPIGKAGESKTVGIKVLTSGRAKGGGYVKNVTVTPSTVVVSGSASALKDIQAIETLSLPVDNLTGTAKRSVKLNWPAGVSLASGQAESVDVTLEFGQPESQREMTIGFDLRLPANLKLESSSPSTVKVVLSGPTDVLSALSPSSVVLLVDFTSKPAGTVISDLRREQVVLPSGISAISVLPSSAEFKLSPR